MKVQELLANITMKDFNLAQSLQVKTYLPFDVKKTIAQGVIYDCVDDSEGAIKVDSVARYMSYIKYMITMHTNLEYTDADYDILCSTEYGETNLLNVIMDCFGEDAKECSRVLNLMMDDLIQEMTIEFSVARLINNLNSALSGLANQIGNFDLRAFLPESLDTETLSTFLQTFIK